MGMKLLKIVLKVLSAGIILFLLYYTFMFGWLGEGKHLINPYVDTHFAPDYSPEKFDKIKIGMTLYEVDSIIGEPFYSHPDYDDSTKIRYYYTSDGLLLSKMRKQGKRYYYDCAWYRSIITFDTNNIVVEIDKGWSYD
jgi:outer membrane protein assembly factor BamE (lipoprotein component of BamABCDE complex)